MSETDDATAPPLGKLLAEAPAWLRHPPFWGRVDRVARGRSGGGRAVLVIPGFLATDRFTARLRNTLSAAGYAAHGWGLGENRGITPELLDRLLARVDALPAPLALIGWSLGGLYAREIAKRRPDRIDRVLTLGSPFSGSLRANHAWRAYERINGHGVDALPIAANLAEKPPVPTFALWSANDGIVAPACTRGGDGESDHRIAVACRHLDFVSSPRALAAILDALAAGGAAETPHPDKR